MARKIEVMPSKSDTKYLSGNVVPSSHMSDRYEEELGDHIYMTQLLSEPSDLDLHVVATSLQCLSEAF